MDLVVGATGLVGQQIALGLRRQGRAVRALVRNGTRHERPLRWLRQASKS